MFEEHGGRQHDIGHIGRLGHELLMHGDEKIVAQETLLYQPLFGRDIDGIGVLDKQCRHRAAVAQRIGIARQHGADLRLVELTHIGVGIGRSHQLRLVEPEDIAIIVERAAAFILPGAEHGGDRQGGVHGDSTVSLASKP